MPDASASAIPRWLIAGTIVVLGCCVTAAAQPWWWPPDFTVAPACSSGCISITLSGVYPDSCRPNVASVQVLGADIRIETVASYPPSCPFCLQVINSWHLPVRVQGLTPGGTYQVYASFRHDPAECRAPIAPTHLGSITVGGCLVGDIDCSGDVSLADLADLLSQFGCTAAAESPCTADIDGDCDVDLGDLTLLLSHFGCAVGTCPSPCP